MISGQIDDFDDSNDSIWRVASIEIDLGVILHRWVGNETKH